MTLQWTFIATFLYTEIGLVTLLLLPFISPGRWQRIFRSTLLNKLSGQAHIYFNVFIGILVLLFLDAVREVKKYAAPTSEVDLKHTPEAENLAHMRLFRAQRNLYIAGFALFLWFIVRRLVTLISAQAKLVAECEASQKQAKSATEAAQKMLEEKDNKTNKSKVQELGAYGEGDDITKEKELAKELDGTKQQLEEALSGQKKAEKDLDALKKQAEGTNLEYDRLLKEMSKLQDKLKHYEEEGSKKDN